MYIIHSSSQRHRDTVRSIKFWDRQTTQILVRNFMCAQVVITSVVRAHTQDPSPSQSAPTFKFFLCIYFILLFYFFNYDWGSFRSPERYFFAHYVLVIQNQMHQVAATSLPFRFRRAWVEVPLGHSLFGLQSHGFSIDTGTASEAVGVAVSNAMHQAVAHR